MNKKVTYSLFGFLCVCFANFSQAQLAIDQIIFDFPSGAPQQSDVQLANTSDVDTLFINIEVLEVGNPGAHDETQIVADDPSKVGLIATPSRVILPPGNTRQVRLVNLFPADDGERIFRVNFTPVAGSADGNEEEANAVRLMVGYQALVIVRPNKTNANIIGKRVGNNLMLTNNGNTNVYLDRIRYCDSVKPNQCEPIVENRLYPGNIWELDLPGDGSVVLNAFDGQSNQTMNF